MEDMDDERKVCELVILQNSLVNMEALKELENSDWKTTGKITKDDQTKFGLLLTPAQEVKGWEWNMDNFLNKSGQQDHQISLVTIYQQLWWP